MLVYQRVYIQQNKCSENPHGIWTWAQLFWIFLPAYLSKIDPDVGVKKSGESTPRVLGSDKLH